MTFGAALMVGAIVVAWTVLRVDRAATAGTEEVTDAVEGDAGGCVSRSNLVARQIQNERAVLVAARS
jgi:hypothetical protein